MTSIEENGGYVEHIQPKEENKCEAIAESTINKGASNSGFQKTNTKLLKQELSFAAVVALDGHKFKKVGRRLVCLCPFHKEKTPSFNVEEDDIGGRCYGCDWHGDIFDYEMKARDVSFPVAVERLEKKRKNALRSAPFKLYQSIGKKRPELTQQQVEIMNAAAVSLACSESYCYAIASKRNWKSSTIKQLAAEKCLGWYENRLAFIYPIGMKLRKWPDRDFFWKFGGPSIWRAQNIEKAKRIFITEGETDIIRLVDVGLEKHEGYRVIALASATSIPPDIADLLKGKQVSLCMDNDPAGQKATDRLIAILKPVCSDLTSIDLQEVAGCK